MRDLLAYERLLADPQPASNWVLAAGKKLARSHPDWPPSAGAVVSQQRAPTKPRITRYLDSVKQDVRFTDKHLGRPDKMIVAAHAT